MYAQIINEQNLIQHPIIENEPYRKKVFRRIPYHLQSIFNLNAVLLPTLNGELYGDFVPRFKQVTKRIQFGKKLPLFCLSKITTHYLRRSRIKWK